MLMPKKNRIAIYELLFKEGVMVAKKDVHVPKHPELADKNMPMQSLKSRGYVKEQFAWRRFYWYPVSLRLPAPTSRDRARHPAPQPSREPQVSVQRVSGLQDSQEGRQTETPTGVLCPLELTRRLRLGLAQQWIPVWRGFGRGRGQPPQ